MKIGQPVWLSIRSEISSGSDEPEVYTLDTEGHTYEKGETIYIAYEESALSGMEGDKTVLRIDQNRVVMRRYGVHKSEIIFEKGTKTFSAYHTPQGVFSMECLTKELSIKKNPVSVDIGYSLNISGLSCSENRLEVSVFKRENAVKS